MQEPLDELQDGAGAAAVSRALSGWADGLVIVEDEGRESGTV